MIGWPSLLIDGQVVDPDVFHRMRTTAGEDIRRANARMPVLVGGDDPLAVLVASELSMALDRAFVIGWPERLATPMWVAGHLELRTDGDRISVIPRRSERLGEVELPGPSIGLWTSGSTGNPRLVLLTRKGFDYQATETAKRLEIDSADRMLLPLRLSHAYGLSVVAIARHTGAQLQIETQPSAQRVARRVIRDMPTTLDGFPYLYERLCRAALSDSALRAQLQQLRAVGCGGDVLTPTLAETFSRDVGLELLDGYGLTEAGPNVAISGPSHRRRGTVGLALVGTELRTTDGGELLVRSPSVMRGYVDPVTWRITEANPAGWLATGDTARIDPDGYVSIVGRVKDVLTVLGEAWPPQQIEAAASESPAVAEAAVVGIPGAHEAGDRIILFVVGHDGALGDVALASVKAACRKHLPPRLRPHDIFELESMPTTASGKTDRRALRQFVVGQVVGHG